MRPTEPSSSSPSSGMSEKNRAFYSQLLPGQDDYWKKMAAPRFRVKTICDRIAESLKERGGERLNLIDLGCGGGQLLAEIATRFPSLRLSGADLAEPQLEVNRRTMLGCEFFAMDLNRANEVSDSLAGRFDLITASEVIEHVEHPEHLLSNAAKLAQKNARLFLSTQSGMVHKTERRVGHLRHYTAEELSVLLRATSWTPLAVWNSGFPFHDLSKWYANRNPDASLREFGEKAYGLKQELICLLLRAAFRFNSQRHGAQLFAVAERAL